MRLTAIILVLASFALSGCASVPGKPIVTGGGEVPLLEVCRKYAIDCRWDGVAQTMTSDYKGVRIRAMAGSNILVIGDKSVALSGPLVLRRGVVYVPADLERTVFGSPAEARPQAPSSRIGIILVDPGHGGKDPGAIGFGGLQEKDLVLDIGRRVREGLVKAGFKAALTRDSDEFISLQDRTLAASHPGTDLFISIHANANKSRGARGVEVYYSGLLSAKDSGEAQRRLNIKTLCEKLNMRSNIGDLKDIVADMLYAHKQALSAGLADAVTRGFSDDTGAHTRGSKPERFFVLRNTLVPAILVEIGFITNPREARLLKDDTYRDKVADAIVRSLREFLYASGI